MNDAWCPYCDKPLGRHASSGKLLKTCGSHECHHAAIRASLMAKNVARPSLPVLDQHPWRSREIDFRNGFESQNLIFNVNFTRLRT